MFKFSELGKLLVGCPRTPHVNGSAKLWGIGDIQDCFSTPRRLVPKRILNVPDPLLAVGSGSDDVILATIGLFDREKATITRYVNFEPLTLTEEQIKVVINTGIVNNEFVGFRPDWEAVFKNMAFTPGQLAALKKDVVLTNEMVIKAAEILNDDALWAKAVKLYQDKNNFAYMNAAIDFRDHYKALVNTVVTGIGDRPPQFLMDDHRGSKGGAAYTAFLGGPIYVRSGYLNSGNQAQRADLLLHEYARTYLMNKVTMDLELDPLKGRSLLPSDLKYVENWDKFIGSLALHYARIKAIK